VIPLRTRRPSEISDDNPLFRAIGGAAMEVRLGHAALKAAGLYSEHLGRAVSPLTGQPLISSTRPVCLRSTPIVRRGVKVAAVLPGGSIGNFGPWQRS
jgi:hypothetical protein